MIDKILRLNDESRYYVLDELNYCDKKIVFCVECSNDDDLYKDNYLILELSINENKLIAKSIDDVKILENVKDLLLLI